MRVICIRAGFLTTVQDLGRFGFRRFGVASGGALDAHALRLCNLLVGNAENAAGLELTAGPVKLQFSDARLISWSGGDYEVAVNGSAAPAGRAVALGEGSEVSVTGPKRGCRAWLAISGGLDLPQMLGSRSTDLRAHFGGLAGRSLSDGDILRLGANSPLAELWMNKLGTGPATWSAPHQWTSPATPEPSLRFVRGVDWDRFELFSTQTLLREFFTVTAASDRMGVRLQGTEFKRRDSGDLTSQPVAPGTVQVPPSGQPIVLLGDCQTIGGYPKIAHVITVDFSVAAQLRAGDEVHFREVLLADAHRLLAEREQDLAEFRAGLQMHT